MSTKHHPLGPSRLERFAKCPGSYMAGLRVRGDMTDEDWDKHTSSPAAAEGTMLHAEVATILTEKYKDKLR